LVEWERRAEALKAIAIGRQDLSVFGGKVALSANVGVKLVSGQQGKNVKVYFAGMEILNAGNHYFYFGTSTSPPTITNGVLKVFLIGNAVGRNRQLMRNPVMGGAGDDLYIVSEVAETALPFDLQYVVE